MEIAETEVESESEDTVEKERVNKDTKPKALEIEGQVMWLNFVEALLVLDRRCHPLSKDAPLLEACISRHSGVLVMKWLGIRCIVEDDGGGSAKMYNAHGCWTKVAGIPRIQPWECKRGKIDATPQITAEMIMLMQERLHWLGITTPAELEKMDDKFFNVVLFSGQGRHGNLVMGHFPKLWCRRNLLDDSKKYVEP